MTFCTRFAPSPTGLLHLGHAYSALLSHDMTLARSGEFLLRIEDTDTGRCRPEFETAIYEDLQWLGLSWPDPVMHQSGRIQSYDQALQTLIDAGYCYPCSCSRRDINDAISAPQEGASTPDGPLYPGTCRHRLMAERSDSDAIRLNMEKALKGRPEIAHLDFTETGTIHGAPNGANHHLSKDILLNEIGDIVLARRENTSPSYHLSVVVDDAAQEITHVVRGEDLFSATKIHRVLQALLNLPTPIYHHHRLIRDEAGKRLAKRDDARAIRTFRDAGATVQDIRQMVGL
ncbi:MAG: tRNA glutamyl-Q(34) synthetase GluQRS [Marinosulfonomonas sp.]|nr:tRNA glutamyl-Q(34) synthetase GluQRS [Marinosulfonomonas sp.]